MPAWHHRPRRRRVSLVNIGVGPSNAKTITDHVGVLRPDTDDDDRTLRRAAKPSGASAISCWPPPLRADHVLDDVLPTHRPGDPQPPTQHVPPRLSRAPEVRFRVGVVHTTDNRNWEFNQRITLAAMRAARASRSTWSRRPSPRTVSGTASRTPPCSAVSDKPFHAHPSCRRAPRRVLPGEQAGAPRHRPSTASDRVRREYTDGLPTNEAPAPPPTSRCSGQSRPAAPSLA